MFSLTLAVPMPRCGLCTHETRIYNGTDMIARRPRWLNLRPRCHAHFPVECVRILLHFMYSTSFSYDARRRLLVSIARRIIRAHYLLVSMIERSSAQFRWKNCIIRLTHNRVIVFHRVAFRVLAKVREFESVYLVCLHCNCRTPRSQHPRCSWNLYRVA